MKGRKQLLIFYQVLLCVSLMAQAAPFHKVYMLGSYELDIKCAQKSGFQLNVSEINSGKKDSITFSEFQPNQFNHDFSKLVGVVADTTVIKQSYYIPVELSVYSDLVKNFTDSNSTTPTAGKLEIKKNVIYIEDDVWSADTLKYCSLDNVCSKIMERYPWFTEPYMDTLKKPYLDTTMANGNHYFLPVTHQKDTFILVAAHDSMVKIPAGGLILPGKTDDDSIMVLNPDKYSMAGLSKSFDPFQLTVDSFFKVYKKTNSQPADSNQRKLADIRMSIFDAVCTAYKKIFAANIDSNRIKLESELQTYLTKNEIKSSVAAGNIFSGVMGESLLAMDSSTFRKMAIARVLNTMDSLINSRLGKKAVKQEDDVFFGETVGKGASVLPDSIKVKNTVKGAQQDSSVRIMPERYFTHHLKDTVIVIPKKEPDTLWVLNNKQKLIRQPNDSLTIKYYFLLDTGKYMVKGGKEYSVTVKKIGIKPANRYTPIVYKDTSIIIKVDSSVYAMGYDTTINGNDTLVQIIAWKEINVAKGQEAESLVVKWPDYALKDSAKIHVPAYHVTKKIDTTVMQSISTECPNCKKSCNEVLMDDIYGLNKEIDAFINDSIKPSLKCTDNFDLAFLDDMKDATTFKLYSNQTRNLYSMYLRKEWLFGTYLPQLKVKLKGVCLKEDTIAIKIKELQRKLDSLKVKEQTYKQRQKAVSNQVIEVVTYGEKLIKVVRNTSNSDSLAICDSVFRAYKRVYTETVDSNRAKLQDDMEAYLAQNGIRSLANMPKDAGVFYAIDSLISQSMRYNGGKRQGQTVLLDTIKDGILNRLRQDYNKMILTTLEKYVKSDADIFIELADTLLPDLKANSKLLKKNNGTFGMQPWEMRQRWDTLIHEFLTIRDSSDTVFAHIKTLVHDTTLVNDTIRSLDSSATQLKSSITNVNILKFDSVQMEFEGGVIKNLVLSGDYEGTHRLFTNLYPIPISALRDGGLTVNYFLYDVYNYDHIIPVRSVIFYTPHLHSYSEDYSPADTVINIKPTQPTRIMFKERVTELLRARIYTDFMGYVNNNPNGLVQIEVSKKFNFFSRFFKYINAYKGSLDPRHTSTSYIGWFNYYFPVVTWSKIEDLNKDLQILKTDTLVYYPHQTALHPDRSLTNSTPKNYVSTMGLLSHIYLTIKPVNFNIFSMHIPAIKSSFDWNVGAAWNLAELADTVYTKSDTISLIRKYQVNSTTINTEWLWNYQPDTRIAISFSANFMYLQLWSASFEQADNPDRYAQFVAWRSGAYNAHMLINPILNFGYTPFQVKSTSAQIFFRMSYYAEISRHVGSMRDNYLQTQLGMSFTFLK